MISAERRLIDLVSVGPATVNALKSMGITSVHALASCDAQELYNRLSQKRHERQDPCVRDVFSAAIAQAKNPRLPQHMRNWWYWSKVRKSQD